MNRVINQATIDDLEKRLESELKLLAGCETEFGAFERIAMRVMPLLRKEPLTQGFIHFWEQQNCNDTLLKRAYMELEYARQALSIEEVPVFVREKVEHIFEERVRKEGTCFNISEVKPPFLRVYYEFKTLYVNAVSKTWDITFAPSADRLIKQTSQGELALKCDADPQATWMQLCWFEECWRIRNEILWIGWHRNDGNGLDVWLKAHQGYMRARCCRMAGDFSFVDHYGADRKTEFFHVDILTKWLKRVIVEFFLMLRQKQVVNLLVQEDVEPVLPSEGQKEHWRTCYHKEDLEKLLPIGKEVWNATVHSGVDMSLVSKQNVAEEISRVIKLRGGLLHSSVNNRFLVAAEKTDPRLWEGGKYMGLKP